MGPSAQAVAAMASLKKVFEKLKVVGAPVQDMAWTFLKRSQSKHPSLGAVCRAVWPDGPPSPPGAC